MGVLFIDMKLILDIFECLKELDLISALIPLIQRIRIETNESLQTQEQLLIGQFRPPQD